MKDEFGNGTNRRRKERAMRGNGRENEWTAKYAWRERRMWRTKEQKSRDEYQCTIVSRMMRTEVVEMQVHAERTSRKKWEKVKETRKIQWVWNENWNGKCRETWEQKRGREQGPTTEPERERERDQKCREREKWKRKRAQNTWERVHVRNQTTPRCRRNVTKWRHRATREENERLWTRDLWTRNEDESEERKKWPKMNWERQNERERENDLREERERTEWKRENIEKERERERKREQRNGERMKEYAAGKLENQKAFIWTEQPTCPSEKMNGPLVCLNRKQSHTTTEMKQTREKENERWTTCLMHVPGRKPHESRSPSRDIEGNEKTWENENELREWESLREMPMKTPDQFYVQKEKTCLYMKPNKKL